LVGKITVGEIRVGKILVRKIAVREIAIRKFAPLFAFRGGFGRRLLCSDWRRERPMEHRHKETEDDGEADIQAVHSVASRHWVFSGGRPNGRKTDRRSAALNGAADSAEPKEVDARMVPRPTGPGYSTVQRLVGRRLAMPTPEMCPECD